MNTLSKDEALTVVRSIRLLCKPNREGGFENSKLGLEAQIDFVNAFPFEGSSLAGKLSSTLSMILCNLLGVLDGRALDEEWFLNGISDFADSLEELIKAGQ